MVEDMEDYTTPETQDQNSKENYSYILKLRTSSWITSIHCRGYD
jgi:hypothetical protein